MVGETFFPMMISQAMTAICTTVKSTSLIFEEVFALFCFIRWTDISVKSSLVTVYLNMVCLAFMESEKVYSSAPKSTSPDSAGRRKKKRKKAGKRRMKGQIWLPKTLDIIRKLIYH